MDRRSNWPNRICAFPPVIPICKKMWFEIKSNQILNLKAKSNRNKSNHSKIQIKSNRQIKSNQSNQINVHFNFFALIRSRGFTISGLINVEENILKTRCINQYILLYYILLYIHTYMYILVYISWLKEIYTVPTNRLEFLDFPIWLCIRFWFFLIGDYLYGSQLLPTVCCQHSYFTWMHMKKSRSYVNPLL